MSWVQELAQYVSAESHSTLYVKDGEKRYNTKHEPLTEALVERHLSGGQEIGVHLLDKSGKGHCIVLDFDDHDGTDQRLVNAVVRSYAMHLDHHSIPCIIERSRSGTGYHIWLVFEKPRRYDQLRDAAKRLLAAIPTDKDFLVEGSGGVAKGEVEIFPKGSSVGASNIALPGAGKSVRLELDGQMELVESDRDDVPLLKAAKTGPKSDRSKPVSIEAAVAAYKVTMGSKVDDYKTWYTAGFHLKSALGEDGFEHWHAWAKECDGYESEEACRTKWKDDLKPVRCPPETFWAYAKKGGYSGGLPEGVVLKGREGDKVLLFDLVSDLPLFRSDIGIAFAEIGPNNVVEVTSQAFENWLRCEAEDVLHEYPAVEHVLQVQKTLVARASKQERREVHLRVAHVGGKSYLDLGDDDRTIMEIDDAGYRLAEDAPPFRRSPSMHALPMPENGEIDELRRFVNMDDDAFAVALAVLVKWFFPDSATPIVNLTGEYGSAKTSTMRFLRAIIDNAAAMDAGPPKNESDLAVRAHHNYVVSIDNAASLERLSDAFCRLCTGTGIVTRLLYTNGEAFVLEYKRPMIVNGIDAEMSAPDLLSRTIDLYLERVEERKSEVALGREFDEAHPRLLGAVLSLVSRTMRVLPSVEVSIDSRMPDFVRIGEATARVIGRDLGWFEAWYGEMMDEHDARSADDAAIVTILGAFFDGRDGFKGSVKELLAEVMSFSDDHLDKRYAVHVPDKPSHLGQLLTKYRRSLGERGITFTKRGRRIVVLHDRDKAVRDFAMYLRPDFAAGVQDMQDDTPRT